jgi:aryl-alcohol dehydrogenase-like predicted oxidoreductase
MQKRNLGKTGLNVPVITLGGNVFAWTIQEAAAFRLLDRALEQGINFVDTANTYPRWVPGNRGGESEAIIGNWLAQGGKRDRVIVASKVGMEMGDGSKGLSAKYILQSAEESLRRLQTDYIDVYYSHADDPSVPLEETLGAHQRLIEQGKVRHIGASNYKGARLREALETSKRKGLPAYGVLQPLYNLMEREEYEKDLAPVVKEYGLGVGPYFALASGFLTGKYRSAKDLEGKARGGIVGKYLNARGLAVLEALDEAAKEYGSKPACVAIAWLIAQPVVTSAIASATSEAQLDDLLAAADLRLEAGAIEKLSAASAAGVAA